MAEIFLSSFADALGGPLPADAVFTATATSMRSAGPSVVANRPVTVPLKAGVPDARVILDASGPDWCWHIRVSFPALGLRVDRWVSVPATDVDWADLVDVDPATLQPSEGAVPAWTAAVSAVTALLAETVAARDAAAVSSATAEGFAGDAEAARDAAALSATGAGISAGAASLSATAAGDAEAAAVLSETAAALSATDANLSKVAAAESATAAGSSESAAGLSATAAAGSANAAALSKTGADTAKTAAEAARDLALAGQFAGASIGDISLDTVVTPGMYYFAAAVVTGANGYPFVGRSGAMEVLRGPGAACAQRITSTASGVSEVRGEYQRRWNGAWTAWRFIPSQRVDQTAGRAIYTWDDVNNREQLIYGDTGLRDMSSFLDPAKWEASTGSIYLHLERTEREVKLMGRLRAVVGLGVGATLLNAPLPTGFRSVTSVQGFTSFITGTAEPFGSGRIRSAPLISGDIDIRSPIAAGTDLSLSLSWRTNDSWPVVLPGTPVGGIPNA